MASTKADSQPVRRLRWYAVRCDNTRAVVKAGVGIARLGVHVFIPKAFRTEKRGKWLVSVPDGLLLPPYLFIAMRSNGPWRAVKDAEGVDKIMGCRDGDGNFKAMPIPYREMRKIRRAARAGERRKDEARFKPGQTVKIVNGPFSGFDGIFDRPAKERVRILVSLFGRQSEIELEEADVRAA
jgi:transcriptional antiterminator NusG